MPDVTSIRRNSALWLGLLLFLLAIASNAFYFAHLSTHITPWLNLTLPVLALLVLLVGVVRAFRQPQIYRGKIWGTTLTVLSLLICVGSVLFFMVARSVPRSDVARECSNLNLNVVLGILHAIGCFWFAVNDEATVSVKPAGSLPWPSLN